MAFKHKKNKYWVSRCPNWYDWNWAVSYKDKDNEILHRALFETYSDAKKFLKILEKDNSMDKIKEAIKHYEGNKIDREIIVTVTDKKTALAALKTIEWIFSWKGGSYTSETSIQEKFTQLQKEV